LAKTPAHNAVEVRLSASLVITFSEAIAGGTLAYEVTPGPGAWSEMWSSDARVVTLAHAPFPHGVRCASTLVAAKDRLGNPLADVPYAWHFDAVLWRTYLPFVRRAGHMP
jgi:hypothetical protein